MDDKIYKCKECGSIKLIVKRKDSCSDCKYNGIRDEEGDYVHAELLTENTFRTQVDEEGECELGCSSGDGCWMLICSDCDNIVDIVPCVIG